jgi:hypothetical protein
MAERLDKFRALRRHQRVRPDRHDTANARTGYRHNEKGRAQGPVRLPPDVRHCLGVVPAARFLLLLLHQLALHRPCHHRTPAGRLRLKLLGKACVVFRQPAPSACHIGIGRAVCPLEHTPGFDAVIRGVRHGALKRQIREFGSSTLSKGHKN